MDVLLWFLVGYLFGSFPTGYIVARLKGIDILNTGSGNIGGANIYRALGAKYAAITALGDVLKGYIPTFIAPTLPLSVVAASGALVGAIFSIFIRFRGGKGFGTLVGDYLALFLKTGRWDVFLILLVTWITTVTLSKFTSLANLVTVSTAVPVTASTLNPYLTAFSVFSLFIIYYSHRSNVRRLLEGKERSFLVRVKEGEKW